MKQSLNMDLRRHGTTGHAAYHDLLQSLRDDAAADLRGTPTRVVRGARAYWYDTFRIGTDVRKAYIGEETPELLARLAQIAQLREAAQDRRRHRTRLVRILRAEGYLSTDAGTGSLLSAMAGAGVFRLGGTLVGTAAFRLYEGELGLRLGFDALVQTGDLDIASFERLSLVLEDAVSPPLQAILGNFAFDPVPALPQEGVWRWRQGGSNQLVEFLTPSFDEEEGVRPLPALGTHARALHHLNYLIAGPVPAAALYRGGVLVQIPRPERFAVHKLIVAERRRDGGDGLKAVKDRAQAALLIRALAEDRPDELAEAFETAWASGPKWRARLTAALKRLPGAHAQLRDIGVAGEVPG